MMKKTICIGNGQIHDAMTPSIEICKTLNCLCDPMKIMTERERERDSDNLIFDARGNGDGNVSCTITGAHQSSISDYTAIALNRRENMSEHYIVRRLTPMECERLQGYPDNWTNIGDWVDSKGKKHKGDADAPRYKALGNSIALPYWDWLAERITSQYDRPTTMGSLFDGIGGFPLCFSRHNCEPVWASEIEEFPIAVTKLRFPEKVGE